MNSKRKVRMALIGTGGYGASIGRAALRSDYIDLAYCFDINRENALKFTAEASDYQRTNNAAAICHTTQTFAGKTTVEILDSFEDILAREDIEAILLVTPNQYHKEQIVQASQAGKHIFVEKPMCVNVAEGTAIIKACNKANIILTVGHNGRRKAGHRLMKQIIDKGDIGRPITAEGNFSRFGVGNMNPESWRFRKSTCPGLPFTQLGVHQVDTLQYLIGYVKKVSSMFSRLYIDGDNHDTTVALMEFQCGALGYVGAAYCVPGVYYINVYGTEANLWCIGGGDVKIEKHGSRDGEIIPIDNIVDTQLEEVEDFAKAIIENKRLEVTGISALWVVAVMQAVVLSNERGGVPVDLLTEFEEELSPLM